MKKVLMLLLGIVMLIASAAGCSSNNAPAVEEPTTAVEEPTTDVAKEPDDSEGETFEIYYIAKQLSDPFCNWMTTTMEQMIESDYPSFNLTTFDGQLSVETRMKLMEDAIVKKPDMLILQFFDEVEVGIIQEVIDAGIHVVVTNGHYTSVDNLCSFVDIDPYEQGAVVAKKAAEDLPENAKVVLILGVAGNQHSVAREKAWDDYLFAARPDIECLARSNADWDKDKAMALMEDWLQAFPEIDGVVSCYDSMTLGAMEALKGANRLEGCQLYGTDALPDACLAIETGEYHATVLQDGYAIAEGALKICYDYLVEGNTSIQELYTETPLIDSTNVAEMLKTHRASGMLKE